MSREAAKELVPRDGTALRELALWRMLDETAARSAEVLALDVGDLDLPSRRLGDRQGRAADVTVLGGLARLLPRLLRGRTSGPAFLTERRARTDLPPASSVSCG